MLQWSAGVEESGGDAAEVLDVVIVGAGPAGLAAGVRAAQHGLSHRVLDRARLAHTVQRYRRGKFVMAEPASLATHPELALGFEAGSREAVLEQWQRDVEAAGVQLAIGPDHEVVGLEGHKGAFRVLTRCGEAIRARHVVIASGRGGSPRVFEVSGADLSHVTYELADAAACVDLRIVVVGAGDSAIEDVLALSDENDVTLVQRREGFDRAKPGNRSAIEGAIQRGEVEVWSSSAVLAFEPKGISVQTPQGERALGCDLVIGRLGARPPRSFLEQLGIAFESADAESAPLVSENFESSREGVYLIGEVNGASLIKYCLNQGYEVIEHILGRRVQSAAGRQLASALAPLGLRPAELIERVRGVVPLYASLGRRQAESLCVESQLHRVARGATIYREGDYRESLFVVLEGSVELEAEGPLGPRTLGPGQFFGEECLFSGQAQRHSARARRASLLLETPRTVLLPLLGSLPAVTAMLEEAWRVTELERLLPGLVREECAALASRHVPHSFAAGEILFREGDPGDGLYLIRRGAVTIARLREGRERTVNRLVAGQVVGEVAAVHPTRSRTATVRAAVHTEVSRIPAEAIEAALHRSPELRSSFEKSWRAQVLRDEHLLGTPEPANLLDFAISEGAKEATDLLVIDELLCIRCDNCEKACAQTHEGVSRLDREAGPRHAGLHFPTSCQHCENAPCMQDCPPGSIRRHPDGEIYIDETCIGCGNCAVVCSYGVIQMTQLPGPRAPGLWRTILFGARPRPERATSQQHEVAVKCDLCRNVPGRDRAPVACVAACPTGAMARVAPEQLLEQLAGAVRGRALGVEEIGGAERRKDGPASDLPGVILELAQRAERSASPDDSAAVARELRRLAELAKR